MDVDMGNLSFAVFMHLQTRALISMLFTIHGPFSRLTENHSFALSSAMIIV